MPPIVTGNLAKYVEEEEKQENKRQAGSVFIESKGMTKLVGYLVERSGRNIWSKGVVGSATRGRKQNVSIYIVTRSWYRLGAKLESRRIFCLFFWSFFSYRLYAFRMPGDSISIDGVWIGAGWEAGRLLSKTNFAS